MAESYIYDQYNHLKEDLQIITPMIEAVHKEMNLEDIYNVALDSMVGLKSVDMAAIYLINDDRNTAILEAQKNFPKFFVNEAGRISKPTGLTWKVISSGSMLNIEDVHVDPDIGPAGRKLGPHNAMLIPISLDDEVIGVIWIVSYQNKRFNKREIKLLSTLGTQISIAISKAKLYKDLSRKNRYESVVASILSSVHKSIRIEDVLENAVDAMKKNIDGIENVSIYFVEDKKAVLKSYRGYPDSYVKKVREIPYGKGTTWKTIIEGRPRYVKNVLLDYVIGKAGKEIGTMSYLSMPIKYESEIIGCININSLEIDAFDDEELNLLGIVANQIEGAIKNAKQAEAIRKSEERYKEANDRLEIKVEERTAELSQANIKLKDEINERKSTEIDLMNSREQLRALAARLQSVREEERREISREVHDELGQSLTGIKMDISWLEGEEGNELRQKKIESIQSTIDRTIDTVRRIARKLRPGILDDLGLIAAIEWQLQDFENKTNIATEFVSDIDEIDLSQECSTAIFRIFQETLTNIVRHAKAKKVVTRLIKDDKILILEIIDNGIGINSSDISNAGSLGLLGMSERALLFYGTLDIKGNKGIGTSVNLKIPLEGKQID